MVDAEHISKQPVEDSCREDGLPESDEVKSEWYAFEADIAFDCIKYFSGNVFRFEDRDDS